MAIQRLRVDLLLNSESFNKGLKTAEGRLKAFGSKMTSVGKSLSTRITLPLALAGGAAVKSAANFEKLKTQLKVLTGSAAAGSKAFERLVKFSAKTPFQLDELVKANNTLLGFGVSADDAFKHLQNIGDIAAVSGGDLQGISVAFGQVAAAGRLMGQDLLQLINNGVPIIDMLSSSMGVAKSEIKDMVSEGAVTFPVLVKAFQDATAEGGKFQGGMETLSKTFLGQFSTLKDNLNIALAEFGKIIIPVLNDLMTFLTEGLRKLNTFDDDTKKLIVTVGAIAAALPPLVFGIGLVATAFGKVTAAVRILTMAMVKNPLTALAVGITALATASIEALHQLNPMVSRVTTLMNVIKSLGNPLKFQELQMLSSAKAAKIQSETTEDLTDKTDELSDSLKKLLTLQNQPSGTRPKASGLNTSIKPMGLMNTGPIKFNQIDLQPVIQGGQKLSKAAIEMMVNANNIINEGFVNMTMSMAEGLGFALATGGNVAENMFNIMLSGIAMVMSELGRMMVTTGAAMIKFNAAMKALSGPTMVITGLLLIAAAGAIKGVMAKNSQGVASFAKGGIVSGPTLAMVGDNTGAGRGNPEVIAPLNKLKGMIDDRANQQINVGGQFRVEGQDLVLALQRADRERNRIN